MTRQSITSWVMPVVDENPDQRGTHEIKKWCRWDSNSGATNLKLNVYYSVCGPVASMMWMQSVQTEFDLNIPTIHGNLLESTNHASTWQTSWWKLSELKNVCDIILKTQGNQQLHYVTSRLILNMWITNWSSTSQNQASLDFSRSLKVKSNGAIWFPIMT